MYVQQQPKTAKYLDIIINGQDMLEINENYNVATVWVL